MEAIKEVLKGLVARCLDGAYVFATIFFLRVRILSASRRKMWDYEHDEPRKELQDLDSSGLWRWLEGMIAGETRRFIGGSSPFWSGSPPNLVSIRFIFNFSPFFGIFPSLSVIPSLVVTGSWQAQIPSSPQKGAERGCRSSRTTEEGRGQEEKESTPCPGT